MFREVSNAVLLASGFGSVIEWRALHLIGRGRSRFRGLRIRGDFVFNYSVNPCDRE